jgi:predicted short-subunit dehydrogenase-like oxidoreductase (DUF2520 family)
MAQAGGIDAGDVVFHCSGALASGVLESAAERGALVASVHPMFSFADPAAAVESFAGTWCGVEGDAGALDDLRPAFAAIGAQTVDIDPAYKTVYHAAAVFASNYLVAVLDVALQAWQRAGIDEASALKMMAPLVRGTVENVLRGGPEKALTGPIARGDTATVERQYRAVSQWDAAHGDLYGHLRDVTGRLAGRRKRTAQEQ